MSRKTSIDKTKTKLKRDGLAFRIVNFPFIYIALHSLTSHTGLNMHRMQIDIVNMCKIHMEAQRFIGVFFTLVAP